MKEGMVKMGGNTKGSKQAWYEFVWSQPVEKAVLSRNQRTKCTKRCGWSSGYFEPHPRQRSLQRVLLANASFADLKAWRNRDTISFYVVPPKDSPQETEDLEFAQESLRYS